MWVTGQVLRQKTNLVDHIFYLLYTVCLVLVQMEVVKTLGYDIIDGIPDLTDVSSRTHNLLR